MKALHVDQSNGFTSGSGRLIKTGEGTLRLDNAKNSFSGGTPINHGSLCMHVT
ncbi:MAG: autotransporter-associated beta strand repeat-containing protein [Verrucomicrobiota bacterium]